MPGDWSPRSRRSPWPASECSRCPRPRRRPDRVPVTSTPPPARRAWPPTAPCARCTPPTTGRCTRSSAPRTAPPPTSALLSAGGYANATEQDVFCAHTNCVITELYDQSPQRQQPDHRGRRRRGRRRTSAPTPPRCRSRSAATRSTASTSTGQTGYRDNSTAGIAVNGEPEGMYMVASGTHVNSGCCFDFGNAETNTDDNGAAHMDAVNLSTYCELLAVQRAAAPGSRPTWRTASTWAATARNTANDTATATATSSPRCSKNNGQTTFALKGGNAQSGGLSTWWDGALPSGYSPMHQEGAIVLGTGGDNSNASVGSFFEGVMTSGYPDRRRRQRRAGQHRRGRLQRQLRRPAGHRGHDRRPRRPVRRRHRRRHRDRRRGGGPVELPVLRHRPALDPQLRRLAQHPRPLPRHRRRRHRGRHQGRAVGLQRRRRPEMGPAVQRLAAQSPVGPVPRRSRATTPPTAPCCRSTPATAPPRRCSRSTAAA